MEITWGQIYGKVKKEKKKSLITWRFCSFTNLLFLITCYYIWIELKDILLSEVVPSPSRVQRIIVVDERVQLFGFALERVVILPCLRYQPIVEVSDAKKSLFIRGVRLKQVDRRWTFETVSKRGLLLIRLELKSHRKT